MRRAFRFDVLVRSRCGGRLRVIALIDDLRVIHRILTHVGLPTDVPEPRPARHPPVVAGATPPPADRVVPLSRHFLTADQQ